MFELTTNVAVAEHLGLSPEGVSRLRSGDRSPSWETMVKVHLMLDWSVADQAADRLAGGWSAGFERAIRSWAAAQAPVERPGAAGEG